MGKGRRRFCLYNPIERRGARAAGQRKTDGE